MICINCNGIVSFIQGYIHLLQCIQIIVTMVDAKSLLCLTVGSVFSLIVSPEYVDPLPL